MDCTSSAQHGPKRTDMQAESGKLLSVAQNLALSEKARPDASAVLGGSVTWLQG